MNGWSIVSDTLTYQGNTGITMVIFTGSFSSDTNNTEITIALKKNGVLQENSEMTVEINQTTDINSIALVDMFSMQKGDNISLWIKSDKTGAVITAKKITTSAYTRF